MCSLMWAYVDKAGRHEKSEIDSDVNIQSNTDIRRKGSLKAYTGTTKDKNMYPPFVSENHLILLINDPPAAWVWPCPIAVGLLPADVAADAPFLE